jgi:hypothetical protein
MKSASLQAEYSKIPAQFHKLITAMRRRVANIFALYAVFKFPFANLLS